MVLCAKLQSCIFFIPNFRNFQGLSPESPGVRLSCCFKQLAGPCFQDEIKKPHCGQGLSLLLGLRIFSDSRPFQKVQVYSLHFHHGFYFFCQVASSRATALAWARTSLQSASNFFTVDISLSKLFSAMFSKSRFFTVSRAASSSTFLVFSCPRSALPQMITSPKEDQFFL